MVSIVTSVSPGLATRRNVWNVPPAYPSPNRQVSLSCVTPASFVPPGFSPAAKMPPQ